MTRYLLLCCCLLTFGFLQAQLNENSQRYDRSGKPYPLRKAQDIPELSLLEYSAPENPYYWKNRPPFEGYWQQDVHYLIEAELDVTAHLIRGSLQLTYRNNSPDTLKLAYFHLYQNAFLPGSYREDLVRANHRKPVFGAHEANGKGTEILKLGQNGEAVQYEIDNTLMKVVLNEPLAPGFHAVFDIDFVTYFSRGSEERRMQLIFEKVKNRQDSVYTVTHYNGVNWYPRIAVYDHFMAWHTDQHVGREFYGDFGSFDVRLTLPQHYLAEGTGELVNEGEVLPEGLKASIALENFIETPHGEFASEVIPPDTSKKKTWVFHALNVHDFGFIAGPTFRRAEVLLNDSIRCIAMVRERNAAGWQDAAGFSANVVDVCSRFFGPYPYPKTIVADADDEMEYPMLALCEGTSPTYKFLLAHEIGHNWFYGMLGSNETYRTWMDEGFNQFLSIWVLEQLEGKWDPSYGGQAAGGLTRWTQGYAQYIVAARKGYDRPLNRHAHDFFNSLGFNLSYDLQYYKTAVMLFNLRYLMGDAAFWRAMKQYVGTWKMAHPYPEHFREIFISETGSDLNGFFDDWLGTEKSIDYRVKRVKRSRFGKTLKITFERKGNLPMPLDFTVYMHGGERMQFTIPHTAYSKSTPGVKVLPKWTGWDKVRPTYTTILDLPARLKKVVIDPGHELADVNLLNNQSGPWPVKAEGRLWPAHKPFPVWEHYLLEARPNIWWNGYSGLQLGASVRGSYMEIDHRVFAGVWYSSGWTHIPSPADSLQPFQHDYHPLSFRLDYQTPLRALGRGAEVEAHAMFRDGLHRYMLGLQKKWAIGEPGNPDYHLLYGAYKYLMRPRTAWRDYLIDPGQWTVGEGNASVIAGYERGYAFRRGTGRTRLETRASFLGSENDFAYLNLESWNSDTLLGKLVLRVRLLARYGTGDLPLESQLYLAGGSPEEAYEDEFYRARGFFPPALLENEGGRQTHHVHFGGGLNLRGYSGYRAEYSDQGPAWYGPLGAAINAELAFDRLFPFQAGVLSRFFTLRTYLFYDAGVIGRIAGGSRYKPEFSKFRQDAGMGLALEVRDGHFFLQDKPLVLRVDFPIFVSRPPAQETYFQFRWVLGIGRAF